MPLTLSSFLLIFAFHTSFWTQIPHEEKNHLTQIMGILFSCYTKLWHTHTPYTSVVMWEPTSMTILFSVTSKSMNSLPMLVLYQALEFGKEWLAESCRVSKRWHISSYDIKIITADLIRNKFESWEAVKPTAADASFPKLKFLLESLNLIIGNKFYQSLSLTS